MRKVLLLLPVLLLGLSACTTAQMEALGQSWRRTLCDQYGGIERVRCLERADEPYKRS